MNKRNKKLKNVKKINNKDTLIGNYCKQFMENSLKEFNKEIDSFNCFDNFNDFYKALSKDYDIIVFCLCENTDLISDTYTKYKLFIVELYNNKLDVLYSARCSVNEKPHDYNGNNIIIIKKDNEYTIDDLFNDDKGIIYYKVLKSNRRKVLRIKYSNGYYFDISDKGISIKTYRESNSELGYALEDIQLLDNYFLYKLKK